MSTLIGKIGKEHAIHITRYWGGDANGVCVQITDTDLPGRICLNMDELEQLIKFFTRRITILEFNAWAGDE